MTSTSWPTCTTLAGIHVLVGPIHLRDVHQTLDALFDFHEAAVVGDVRDLAEQPRVRRVAPRDVLPRIGAELLQAQGDALTLAVELQDAHVDLFADLHDLGRMLDALPRHVGDVQQAVDAAEIHERTVVGEVLDHALDGRAFLQIVEQRRALGAVFLLDHGAPRDHDVIALLVELDDLEFERLVLEVRGIAHRPHVDQGAGQKGAHVVDLDGEAALDPAGDDADDHFLFLEGRLEARPGARPLGLLARQPGLARAVLDAVERDLDGLTDGDFDLALLVLELIRGYDGLGLQTDIDDDVILADLDDEAVEYGAGTNPLARDALFKQFRKTFCHVFSIERCPGSFPCAPGVDHNDGDPLLDPPRPKLSGPVPSRAQPGTGNFQNPARPPR